MLFTLILTVVGLFLIIYVVLLLPPVQNGLRSRAEEELSKLMHTKVSIGSLSISNFNQVELTDVKIPSPDGKRCISADKIGAGINLWQLLKEREIVVTYTELIGLDFRLVQRKQGGPLNIQFLIDAFKPKETGKPPMKFDLSIHSVVVRRSSFSFDKLWCPRKPAGMTDFNHLSLSNIRADIDIPRIKNGYFDVDLRSLSFSERSGLELDNLTCHALVTETKLSLADLEIALPGPTPVPSDSSLAYDGFKGIRDALKNSSHHLKLQGDKVTLSDLAPLWRPLAAFTDPMTLSVDATGNAQRIHLSDLLISTPDERLEVFARGDVSDILDRERFTADVPKLSLSVEAREAEKIINGLLTLRPEVASRILSLGTFRMLASGKATATAADVEADIESSLGKLTAQGKIGYPAKGRVIADISTSSDGLFLAPLIGDDRFGKAAFFAEAKLTTAGRDVSGEGSLALEYAEYQGYRLSGVSVEAVKRGGHIEAAVESADPNADVSVSGVVELAGRESSWQADVDLRRFNPAVFRLLPNLAGYEMKGQLSANLTGNSPDNISGTLNLERLGLLSATRPSLNLDYLYLDASAPEEDGFRILSLESDWADADVRGVFTPTELPDAFMAMLARTVPAINLKTGAAKRKKRLEQNLDFILTVKPDNQLVDFFHLPIGLLTDIPVRGSLSDSLGRASLSVDIPYIRQGKDKLIRSTRVSAEIDAETGGSLLHFSSIIPGKKGEMNVSLNLTGHYNDFLSEIGWKINRPGTYDGKVSLSTTLQSAPPGLAFPGLDVKVNPSVIHVADVGWNVSPAELSYRDKKISVRDLRISNGPQFVVIDGMASELPTDTVKVEFADFSLDYLFETLNINYVTFGGNATGKAFGTSLLSKNPVARTDGLRVDSLRYNGALLGDKADLKGVWHNDIKCVGIGARIYEKGEFRASVDGGVWVGADSLSFDFNTDKVNIKFLKPFVAAFSSDIEGRASGQAKLYGTFSDIDMTGRIFADTIRMKVDYTNTWYSGSDSVFLTPGRISVPSFRLYDRYGHSAMLEGNVRHRYFHDPSFEFKLTKARRLLGYDTNARINPDWYGRVFVDGNATIKGRPGIVQVLVDVSTASGTVFNYVLNDTEAAEEYSFLTFSDRRKEMAERERPDTVPDFVKAFRKQVKAEAGRPSIFAIDLRVSVNPEAKLIIVMDPKAGDKITARGSGAMQIAYDSETDNMQMYGKYTIDEGNYNFTLQDLIIRDFKINPGSSIAFNGDPLNATLDIEAAYRVNTNLSDLDKSFSTDRDLNRTNVPVDAILKVGGGLQDPEIDYDIKLPTLTSDVERKVKSIISTDDMMSRQIIYLLALNRFYTPDYMSQSSNGGELASVASSTISSQISNILGQISDKWSIAPSFRSDKGDFSDTEVDLALSSRLLNNRLLINGNFGYRDRSTSQTTFVGDFDIEYLLSRNGNLRLKAYNHFNDQNYYLRSSLTTQGLGVVYRHEFNDILSMFKRKKRKPRQNKADTDTVSAREKVGVKPE